MENHFSIEYLISWRAAQTEVDAPPPPSVARLIELTRPWWQVQPERFRVLVQQFDAMMRVGYAMPPDGARGESYPVPAVVVQTNIETNALADILYVSVRARMLRMRFALRGAQELRRPKLEVTFVAASSPDPLFCATATLGTDGDYRIEIEIPTNLAEDWSRLRVTERMPFRFILRPQDET